MSTADVTWSKDGQPISQKFDDIYFSKENGFEESTYVFLNANQLNERWQNHTSDVFTIGETGFGTGLNFLIAWQAWQTVSLKKSQLHFFSVEKYPLTRTDLQKSLSLWPDLAPLSQKLLDNYPPQPIRGLHRLVFEEGKVILTLYFGEAADGLAQIAPISLAGPNINARNCSLGGEVPVVDAWFLDGFAPAKNPNMWDSRVFAAINDLSGNGTTFSTFTAASSVRKKLSDIGFNCKKIKGFGRKREMLIGTMSSQYKHDNNHINQSADPETKHFRHYENVKVKRESSWHLVVKANNSPVRHCAVIGGGLAGCHTALALATKNIKVTVIEKNPELAQEASGNRQAAMYAKLSPSEDPLSRFNLAALLYANNFYHSRGYYQRCGDQCGVLHLAKTHKQRQHYRALQKIFSQDPQFIRWLDGSDSEKIAGIKLKPSSDPENGALYLPQAGWLSPAEVCEELTKHPLIEVLKETNVESLTFDSSQWELTNAQGQMALRADAVIIANAHFATRIEQCAHLPLKFIRGQVSHALANMGSSQLKTVVCGEGYIAPDCEGKHTFGATFTLDNTNPALSDEDHAENLKTLKDISENFADIQIDKAHAGRVGFRCTSPDYFPLVGPVADYKKMLQTFHFLTKKANATIDEPGDYHPNLYCNVGHGSRGLCYTPLSAEILACIISGQISPVERELYRYIHPARFIIRDLIRNKISP